ncbi:hypothetical protein LA76x_4940 [Lysobacter antibioticus]|uniref:Uncharacterized protein n=1 Tax=Lysobacter antibioticus TaxID=84531 RepID=A0A0S2FHW9_LYSAN|nr:hypothetical protein LA76x_4940 [Lysobacter antibioticus]
MPEATNVTVESESLSQVMLSFETLSHKWPYGFSGRFKAYGLTLVSAELRDWFPARRDQHAD